MKSLYLLLATVLTFIIGAGGGLAMEINPLMTGVGLVFLKMLPTSQVGVLSATVGFDLSDLATEMGAYFRKYEKKIWAGVFQRIEFEKHMAPIGGVSDEYVTQSATIDDVLQPYQCGWTPKGTANFRARVNKVRQMKVDYDFECIDELYQSWLAEMADESKARKDWPFVKYVIHELIMPKMIEEIEAISYNGVFQAPTVGTASPYLDSTDGIGTIISNEITAGNIVPINTGALTPTNMVDRVDFFIDSIPHKYRHVSGVILMSKTNALNYYRDYRANFGGNNNYDGNEDLMIPRTGKKIVGITAMEGSDRIIFTPSKNMIKMYDKILVPGKFDVQQILRKIHIFTDFKRGYGFKNLDTVFVNDQA